MKQVIAFIERGEDGTFSVFMDSDDLDYGVIGEGKTAKEAIEDFENTYTEIRDYYKGEGKGFKEVKIQFKYDVASFLSYYSNIFSKTALERMTGINQKQLFHYASGYRKPSEKTIKKIDDAIHLFADEIRQVHLV